MNNITLPHLIILQCSSTKVAGNHNLIKDDFFLRQLQNIRNEIINEIEVNISHPEELMPAYLRYGANQAGNNGGRLYTHINWHRLLDGIDNHCIKVVIVSALYGLLEYDMPIPYYDIKIQQTRTRWVHNNSVQNALNEYVNYNNIPINNIHSFLSTSYIDIIGDFSHNNCWIRYDRGAQTAACINNIVAGIKSENLPIPNL